MIRVLLADDHPVVRAGLRALLGAEPDLVVELEAATADEAVAHLREVFGDVGFRLDDVSPAARPGLDRPLARAFVEAVGGDDALRREARDLKECVADLTLENRLLKKSMIADGEDDE